ncbi:MAG: DUF4270 domain-containing protein [Flavobacteriaceae bacterium]
MTIFKKIFLFGILSVLISACNSEYNTVGIDLISSNQFETQIRDFPVYISVDSLTDIQSDKMAVMHFGSYDFPRFGRSMASITTQLTIAENPRFGAYTQEKEQSGDPDNVNVIEERERVTSVFLEIPFLVNQNDQDNDGVIDAFDSDPQSQDSDSDSDGITDILERQAGTNPLSQDSDNDGILDGTDTENDGYDPLNRVYEVDSIFGNKMTPFNLKVTELTYYLNTLDPNNNFETSSEYFTSRDYYEEGHVGQVLYDAPYQLNFEELRFFKAEDDPETEDIDETTEVESRLSPRIRVPLNPTFFQEKILDQEGAKTLSNVSSFRDHIRALNIRMGGVSENLYMLLNLSGASIKLTYDYDKLNDQDTEDTSDDVVEVESSSFSISLGGVQINHLRNDQTVLAPTPGLSDQTFKLKGGLGTRGQIRLFDQEEDGDVLRDFRSTEILINEANLIFYVDPSFVENWTDERYIAERLYLYKLEDGTPLPDYTSDNTNGSEPDEVKVVHSGLLEYKDGRPYRYKIRITEHISNLLRSDDEDLNENIVLGLVVTSDIKVFGLKKAKLEGEEQIDYPLGALSNPLGTVLIGPSPSDEFIDKRLKLEVIYTDFSN